MTIVEFQGGLGNQMFQYAFLEELRYKYPEENVTADIYDYNDNSYRRYELEEVFGIVVPKAKKRDILLFTDKIPGHSHATVLRRRIERKLYGKDYVSILHKNYNCFSESYLPEKNDIIGRYLSGWWQNEECFYDVRGKVRDIFINSPKFKTLNICDYALLQDNIQTVSIHIRRGDYVNTSQYDILNMDYYKRAIEIVESKLSNPFYLIFSDEVSYAASSFDFLERKKIINQNSKSNSYKDMILMSKCRHNIIANSTFSWWGAYLNNNNGKVVIAPSRYENSGFVNLKTAEGWIELEV